MNRFVSFVLFSPLLAFFVIACKQRTVPSEALLPVHTALVQSYEVGNGARYSASIVPYSQVNLAFQSGGYIDQIRQVKGTDGGMRNIDQGDWAPKGTVLAVVDQQNYQDKLSQAKEQLAGYQAELDKVKLTFDRTSALYSTQSATKPDFDSAKAQLDSSTASVAAARAQINEAQTALAYCSLKAPFDGWIVSRNVDVGSYVGPATNGFTIANTRKVKAVFGVPDTSISRIKIGQSQTITTDALPRTFHGHVTSISPSADPKSRVFSVEVSIDNPKNELKSGMIASLILQGSLLPHSVTAVPVSAVVRDPQHPGGFAILVTEGDGEIQTALLRSVELGNVYGNNIGVNDGLHMGQRVITSGATLVKSGDKIRVIP
ncbi:MAG TPA: efflux RND transporter periplasmic adaptor subunit [Edaphobacter sp.]|nr:efflux RND transporter periplasmic adaptor subunit [Edaphobacter sp.]